MVALSNEPVGERVLSLFSALRRSAKQSPAPSLERAHDDIARKAAICDGVFAASRALALQGTSGPALHPLLARASELLDDIDRVLVALDPVRDAQTFAVAARLQRQLEQLQVATTDRRRGSARTSSVATHPINTSEEQRSGRESD